MTGLPDRYVIACNHVTGTSAIATGALCYLMPLSGDPTRLRVLARSRGGRWIETWERRDRLTNFRRKTLPPEHPLYGEERLTDWSETALARIG